MAPEINQQTFDLLMSRFDTLERQNAEQIRLLDTHVSADTKVATTVTQHATYFKALFGVLTLGLTVIIGAIAKKFFGEVV